MHDGDPGWSTHEPRVSCTVNMSHKIAGTYAWYVLKQLLGAGAGHQAH